MFLDNCHVALISILLRRGGFQFYRLDSPITFGIDMGTLQKVLKCSDVDDECSLRGDKEKNCMQVQFKSKNTESLFDIKLLNIDTGNIN